MNHQNKPDTTPLDAQQRSSWTRGSILLFGWSLALGATAQVPAFSTYQSAPAISVGAEQPEESAYERAMEAARRDEPGSTVLLQGFLETYPESLHAPEVRLEHATLLLLHGEAAEALTELEALPLMSGELRDVHLFRTGEALLALGRYEQARSVFNELDRIGDPELQNERNYYLAYLDYVDGNYDDALERLGNLPFSETYATTAPYYITQILYRQGKWDDAQLQAERLLGADRATAEQHAELNRIVGECLLRKDNKSEALHYLQNYVSETAEAQAMPIATSAYNCGVLAAEAGDNDGAVKALSQAAAAGLTNDPSTACRAYLLLGQTYLNMGQTLNARLAFERGARTEGDAEAQEAAAYNYAVMVHETQCSPFDEEVTVFEDFLNRYPQSTYAERAGECLTEVYLTTRNYEAALASLDRIAQPTTNLRTARQRLLYRLGVQNYVNGDLTTAETNFTDAIALGTLHPGTQAEAYYWRGECRYATGNYAGAASDFRSFNAAKPTGDATHVASGLYNLGYALMKQQRYAEAITPLKDYTAQPGQRTQAMYADALARIGDCYYYTRQFNSAETYYDAAVGAGGTGADYAAFQQAFMAGLQKKYTAKLDGLTKVITQYPQSEWVDNAYLERGKTYLLLDNNAAAIEAFNVVVTRYGDRQCAPEAGLQLALVYYNSGQTDAAIAAYKQVIASHPGSDEAQTALEDLKNIYVEQGQVATYASYLSTLDGKVPLSAGEQDSLTYVSATRLLAKGRTADAEQAMEQYLKAYPSGKYALDVRIRLARAYRSAGRTADALTHYAEVADVAGSTYADEALLATAEIHAEEGRTAEAYDAYRRLADRTDAADYRRSALMGCTRTAAALGRDAETVHSFTAAAGDAALASADRQEGLLLRAKALLHLQRTDEALKDLTEAATDMRTASGAEARYQLAQTLFDRGQISDAETQVMELINSGTPHRYWLARGFILLSDIALSRDDAFLAKQYLESLQSNYSGDAEISHLIEQRLAKCK